MPELILGNTSVMSESSGTVTLNNEIFANKILQVESRSANYDFGSISNTTPYHCSWLDITMIVKLDNSKWFFSGKVLTDDTNSSSFGAGGGVMYTNNTQGGSWWIQYPPAHEFYTSGSEDSYFPAMFSGVWDSANLSQRTAEMANIIIPSAGDSVTWKYYIRNNNSNAAYFNGNNPATHCQWFHVWEISA
jgi:hypothetical protein